MSKTNKRLNELFLEYLTMYKYFFPFSKYFCLYFFGKLDLDSPRSSMLQLGESNLIRQIAIELMRRRTWWTSGQLAHRTISDRHHHICPRCTLPSSQVQARYARRCDGGGWAAVTQDTTQRCYSAAWRQTEVWWRCLHCCSVRDGSME